MKMNIKALAQQKFKALVIVSFPTEELDDNNQPIFGEARFIGHFRCLSVTEAREHLTELEALREAGDTYTAITLGSDQVKKFFTGFEPVKGEELPFIDDEGNELTSNAQNIELMLTSREVRDAITKTYNEARTGDVLGKNSKPSPAGGPAAKSQTLTA